ncbi:MAG: cytochrome c biogenesis protein CcsA [Pseudomonas sp.]
MTITSFGPANRIARSAETHPLTWRLRDDGEPLWLDEYQAKDGYSAARKALAQMSQDDIVQTVKDSGLKGRGGAGFPTGVKWGLMPKDESMNIRYLLCNADEMEPNTWKDRMLMEQQPHLLIEGMLISARALKAYRGYIFLRGEYTTAARNLNRAVEEAKAAGLLGKNILGSGFDFELFVHTGAGRYICGEETALINSLEGRRANPRSKPPFPAAVGVWGKPTWGSWWVWDARLTSMLILLFLYFGLIALGQAISNRESAAKACAVLAIVGVINIPIIKYSVEWWNTLHQGATFTLTEKPAMPAEMWLPLLLTVLGFYCFFGAVLLLRMRLEVLKREARTSWVREEVLSSLGREMAR